MAYQEPNKDGFYGKFGGRFVPETLMTAVLELEKAYRESQADPSFQEELNQLLRQYVGRETPLYYAKNLTQHIGGAKIYLKREDLNHTGAHKINNALGQVLLAKRMGKKKIISETGAGQHGVATATAAALFNMECTIYMGEEDVKRQALNAVSYTHLLYHVGIGFSFNSISLALSPLDFPFGQSLSEKIRQDY